MKVLEQGFEISYDVYKLHAPKAQSGGTMEGRPYLPKAIFKSKVLAETEDPKLGVQENELDMIFRIECEDETQAIKVNEQIRKLRTAGEVFTFKGSIPRPVGKAQFQIDSTENGTQFLERVAKAPQTKK